MEPIKNLYLVVENLYHPLKFANCGIEWLFQNDSRCEILNIIPNLKQNILTKFKYRKYFIESYDLHDPMLTQCVDKLQRNLTSFIGLDSDDNRKYISIVSIKSPIYFVGWGIDCGEIISKDEIPFKDCRKNTTNFNKLIDYVNSGEV